MKFTHWILNHTPKWFVALAVIVFVLFSAFVLPAQSAKAEAYSREAGSPDTNFFYKPQDLLSMAEAYGPAGRAAYVRARFTFDLIFPFVYGVFLTATISGLLRSLHVDHTRWAVLLLAPFLGVVFDFAENIGAATVIGRYPAPAPLLTILTPYLSMLKWFFVIASFLILICGIVILFLTRMLKSKSA